MSTQSMMRVFLCTLLAACLTACGGGDGGGGDGGMDDGGTDGADTAGTDDGGTMGPMIDQMFDPGAPNQALPISTVDCAQTFVVGKTGTLVSLDLMLTAAAGSTGTLRVDVRNRAMPPDQAQPAEDNVAVLGGVDVDMATLPTTASFVRFEFNPPVSVTMGDMVAFVVRRTAGTDTAEIHGDSGDGYPDGAIFRRPAMMTWTAGSPGDFAFVTRVQP